MVFDYLLINHDFKIQFFILIISMSTFYILYSCYDSPTGLNVNNRKCNLRMLLKRVPNSEGVEC